MVFPLVILVELALKHFCTYLDLSLGSHGDLIIALYVTHSSTRMSETKEEPPVAHDQLGTEPDRLDPWIDDGNIVLAVQGKYFRVHRSILSSYSEVFKDMFDSTQPNEGERSEELIEQCPIVHLHDVANDVQIMLRAMYDRRSVQ